MAEKKEDTDLFGEPIKAGLGPGEHQAGHNQDLGLSLDGDEWDAIDEAWDEIAKKETAAKKAAPD